MTANQLEKALGLSEGPVRRVLNQLRADGLIKSARIAKDDRVGAPPRVYSLVTGGMVELGKVTQTNAAALARVIGEILLEHGEVAVFVGANHEGAVALHHHKDYAFAMDRHIESLVGRYRREEGRRFSPEAAAADLRSRLKELSQGNVHAA